MKNESIFWGFVLVLFGGLLLMENLGLLPGNLNVWSLFWPVILVAIGVRMLLRGSWRGGTFESRDRGTVPAPGAVTQGQPVSASPRAEAYRLPLESARQASVTIKHGAGELRLDDQAGPDELLSGTFVGGVDPRVERGLEQTFVDLRVPSGVFPITYTEPLNWNVGFNPNVPLSLKLEVGASRNYVNLRNLQVKQLTIETGASETDIDFPARAGLTQARVQSGMARVEIRIPENVSARIHTGGALNSIDIDPVRFPAVGSNDYRSPDYEASGNQLDLQIDMGMGAVRIR